MNSRETLKINDNGVLEIGGVAATDIVRRFGTPVYALDEAHIRAVCRAFVKTLESEYGNGNVCYASKAFSCTAIYKIIESERLFADVVSGGEIYTALKAGFESSKLYFHGNNKLPKEIDFAVSVGVGVIVVDNAAELPIIDAAAKKYSRNQKVLLRVNPGVEAHTHDFVQTALPDSKFGTPIAAKEAEAVIENIYKYPNLEYRGLHCHIGSQIFDKEAYLIAIEKLTDFMTGLEKKDIYTQELNLGGGFGIHYTEDDPRYSVEDYCEYIRSAAVAVKRAVELKKLRKPTLTVEPGRAIVGEAGVTLYTAGMIRDIKGVRKYVAVDGGMFENPRFALYRAKYGAIIANRRSTPCQTVTLAGKCCESGDIISMDVRLGDVKSGDVIAVFSTGAYNYSMASNYNRNPVPPVVLVKDGEVDYIVRPQDYEDIVRNDTIPERLKKEQ